MFIPEAGYLCWSENGIWYKLYNKLKQALPLCTHFTEGLWNLAVNALSLDWHRNHKVLRQDNKMKVNSALVPWGLCDPSPLWLKFFFETVTNTDIAFYVFFRMAILTMSHTFARFCVFPFIFYLCLFPLGDKRTPIVPSM